MDIADWRQKIDGIDEQIVTLLNQRAEAASAIGEIKRHKGGAIYEPDREQAVLNHVRASSKGPLNEEELTDIYERVMDIMRSIQKRAPAAQA